MLIDHNQGFILVDQLVIRSVALVYWGQQPSLIHLAAFGVEGHVLKTHTE